MRYDGSEAIKDMDDVLLYGRVIEELRKKLQNCLSFCDEKNLKLKPSKIDISKQVEFDGTLISSDSVKNEQVLSILPKDKRIQAFFDLEKPSNKKDIQVFYRMLASLHS